MVQKKFYHNSTNQYRKWKGTTNKEYWMQLCRVHDERERENECVRKKCVEVEKKEEEQTRETEKARVKEREVKDKDMWKQKQQQRGNDGWGREEKCLVKVRETWTFIYRDYTLWKDPIMYTYSKFK